MAIYTQKSGFRDEAVVEIEQGCVDPEYQAKGIGTDGLMQTLQMVAEEIAKRGAVLKTIRANTRENNYQTIKLLQKLGAQKVAEMPGVFTATEFFYVANDVDKLLPKLVAAQ